MTATDGTMVSKGLMQKVDKYFDLSEDVFSASRSVMQQAKDRGRFYMVNSCLLYTSVVLEVVLCGV